MDGTDPMDGTAPEKQHGRQCRARARSGKRCGRAPIPGGTVCHYHGGAAPQVKAKADERLRALVDSALSVLEKVVKRGATQQLQLQAAKDILDRTGFKATDKVKLEGDVAAVTLTAEDISHLTRDEMAALRAQLVAARDALLAVKAATERRSEHALKTS